MSRIPEGLANALRGIAERLRGAPVIAVKEADEYVAERPLHRGPDAKEAYVAGWLKAVCQRYADEIDMTIKTWSTPQPRARRRR